MELKIEMDGNIVNARLSGRLDSLNGPKIQEEMVGIGEAKDIKTIILDCSGLEYIASNGLRLFFTVVKDARMREANVIIKGAQPFLLTVLDATGLSKMFDFEP